MQLQGCLQQAAMLADLLAKAKVDEEAQQAALSAGVARFDLHHEYTWLSKFFPAPPPHQSATRWPRLRRPWLNMWWR